MAKKLTFSKKLYKICMLFLVVHFWNSKSYDNSLFSVLKTYICYFSKLILKKYIAGIAGHFSNNHITHHIL
jgi:hypothetical protein